MVLRTTSMFKWPFYSWGKPFAQRQLEAFEKMWDIFSQYIHLWPSLSLSRWGCNLPCNTSHLCLCLCLLRQSPGHGCIKIMNWGHEVWLIWEQYPFIWHLVPALFRRSMNKLKNKTKQKLSQRKGSDVAGLSSSLKRGKARLQWSGVPMGE